MHLPRKYTAAEIKEFVDVVRNGDDMTQEKIAGMDMLVEMLNHLGNITDAEIAAYVRSAFRVLK